MISEVKNKTSKYVAPTGKLAHNPTGELIKIIRKLTCIFKYESN